MRRREFITLAGSAAIAWPLATRAQQPASRLTIGYLSGGTVATQGPWIAAFARRLGELGWIEGRDAIIERRLAEGHNERFAALPPSWLIARWMSLSRPEPPRPLRSSG